MNESWGALWIPWTLFLAGAIAITSMGVAKLWARRHERATNSLVTHGLMAILSVAAIAGLSQGRFEAFGFTVGTFRWSFLLLLWTIPSAVLTLPRLAGRGGGPPATPFGLSPAQTVVRVWVVASIAEEILTRGLIQSSLGVLSDVGFSVGAHFLSLPVLTGALAFSAMHLVLLKRIGAKAAPVLVVAFLLGCIAGVYRETTGSLIPAVLVHMLFNVGGAVPLWVAGAVRARRATRAPRAGDRGEGG
ncbi:MAG: CPBP family intramembrane metalloprotease [Candidatus Bipolaricaulis sp.]|nr:CPBP family intramembrane metalloprotease [Candidatus Bipolaricaulis sp.]